MKISKKQSGEVDKALNYNMGSCEKIRKQIYEILVKKSPVDYSDTLCQRWVC